MAIHRIQNVTFLHGFIILTLFFTAPVLHAGKIVRVGYFDKKPVVFSDENGLPEGLAVDILSDIARKNMWKLKYIHGSFSETLDKLESGEIDLMVPLGYTKSREKIIDYSDIPILQSWGSLFTKRGGGIRSLGDVSEKRIAYLKNSLFYEPFKKITAEMKLSPHFTKVASYKEMFKGIEEGRFDGGLGDRLAFSGLNRNLAHIIDGSIVFHPFALHIAARNGDPNQLLKPINNYLITETAAPDSRYFGHLNFWLSGISSRHPVIYFTFLIILGIIVLVFAVYFLFRLPRIRKAFGLTEVVNVRVSINILILAGIFALSLWIIDTLADYFFFSNGYDFLRVLSAKNDPHELFIRVLLVSAILPGGIAVSHLFNRLYKEQNKTRELAENLKITLNSIGDAVIVSDIKGKIVNMNPVAENLTGWSLEEAKGTRLAKVFNIINAKTRKTVENPALKVLESGEIIGLANHTKLISRNNKEYHIADSAAPIRNAEGVVFGVVLIFRDVTENYNNLEALKKNEDRLAKTLIATNDGIWDWNLITDEAYYSENYYKMAGYEPGEYPACSKEFKKRVHPDDYSELIEKFEKHLRGETDKFYAEYRFKKKNGGWLWILERGVIVERDSNGKPARFIGTHMDITKYKELENKLRRLHIFLNNIIDSMPSILVSVDKKGIVTQWNQEAERTTKLSKKEAIGKPIEKAIPRLADRIDQIQKSIATSSKVTEAKVSYKKDNRIFYEDITIYPLIGSDIEGAVIRIDDVTTKVQMEKMIIQSEKMLSVGGLAAGMAHEINNPLAGMMQSAEVIAMRLGKNINIQANKEAALKSGTTIEAIAAFMEERGIHRLLDSITESGERIAVIVKDMLSFARKGEDNRDLHDLGKLLDKTLKLAATEYDTKTQLDYRQITVLKEYEENLPKVSCEGSQIQQVFLNILHNGFQAMNEAGTVKPEFTLKTYSIRDENMVAVEIKDNGPGMDKETCRRIFEPFFTTKHAGEGTGLGLSVSYFIINENHSGNLRVESTPGKGTNFIIELPV